MNAGQVAEMGRRMAESLMTSTCTIRSRGGGFATDPETGEVTETLGDVIYEGKCRVKPASTWGREAEAGGERVAPSTFVISVPLAVVAVERGHSVTVESCPDPWMVGRRFEVRFAPAAGDNVTARRLLCEEPA